MTYEAICSREKSLRAFEGEVRLTETGREEAHGKCPDCGTPMAVLVLTP